MKQILTFLNLIFVSQFCIAQMLSPEEFLATDYGNHFTPHHLLVDYTYHLAEHSPYMTVQEYGKTNEKRPLLLATFTSPDNRQNLESIRNFHLETAQMTTVTEGREPIRKAIIWLSFGVHGNEAGGPESSMTVMYKLANPDAATKTHLDESIILLDPSVNPDGYSRYTNWIWQVAGKELHPALDDREHMEPWPGGRVNHYLFDLNRDWAWQTQIETQQRMVIYNEWMPHIHVDFHEMGHNSHYYFAPAAKPYHDYITDWQRDFQTEIGRQNAHYFDSQSWMYFTRENFDLFYPSYGDTYPTFNGAIGMTYEQAGHSRAGRAVDMNNGDVLTLQDRIDHHTATAMTTIKTTIDNKGDVISRFAAYFDQSVSQPKGKFKSYVIKASESQQALAELLDRNKIQYGISSDNSQQQGYEYFSGEIRNFSVEPGDMVIDSRQPKSTLLQVLFEPEHLLEDSVTYDITAWCLPFAYDVKAYGLKDHMEVDISSLDSESSDWNAPANAYAYYFEWGSHDAHRVLAQLLKEDVHLRLATGKADIGTTSIHPSYLVAIAGDNRHLDNFHEKIHNTLGQSSIKKGHLDSGFSSNGADLGGRNFSLLDNPRIVTLSGDGVGTNAFGQIWSYFENHLKYPLSIADIAEFGRIDLADFDILILPDGFYSLSANHKEDINTFVNRGGKLIAIGGALRGLSDQEGFALARYATEDERKDAKKAAEDLRTRERLEVYGGQERRAIRNSVPGAIIKNNIDSSHPLAYGLGDHYYSLKTSSATYGLMTDAWNVIYVPEDFESYGFIGSKLKVRLGNTVSYAVENKGRGTVIYMVDNPLYRGFWHQGLHIFTNALFLVD